MSLGDGVMYCRECGGWLRLTVGDPGNPRFRGLCGRCISALRSRHIAPTVRRYVTDPPKPKDNLEPLRTRLTALREEMRANVRKPDDADSNEIWSWRVDEWADAIDAILKDLT